MEIKTKFSLDDKICTIKECRIHSFNVSSVTVSKRGVAYGDESYCTYPEEQCFASESDLIRYIKGEENL